MFGKVKNLISKLKYINRLIIDIDRKQTQLVKDERESEKKMEKLSSESKEILLKLECMAANIASVEQITKEISRGTFDYMNLEYLKIPRNEKRKCLLVGFYGAINLGDELMLEKLYTDLGVIKDDLWIMMCDNKELEVFCYPGKNIIHYPKTKFDYNFLADIFDCVVFGGGAIIDDSQYNQRGSFKYDLGKIFIELSLSFIEKEKKVYALGLSTNKIITDREFKNKLTQIIDNSVYFSVRDKYSRKVVEKICGHEVSEINDIVLTNEVFAPKKKSNKFKIGIVWICYPEMRNILEELLVYIQEKMEERELEIRFIQFYNYNECDYDFYTEVCQGKDRNYYTISDMPHGYKEVCEEICKCDVLISMRYHGALLGLMNGVKTLALLYEQHIHYYNKMTDLFEKFHRTQNLFTEIEDLKREIFTSEIAEQVEKIIDNNTEYEQTIDEIIRYIGNIKKGDRD